MDRGLEVYAPSEFTYYPTNKRKRPDILDIVVAENIPYCGDVDTVHELDSDHYPVVRTVDLNTTYSVPKPKHNYAKTN